MSSVATGFKNLVYCVMDDNDKETYKSDVKKLGSAISMKLTPSTSEEELYCDNVLDEVLSAMNKFKVELEIKDLEESVEADIFGHLIDETNGGIIKKATDVAPNVAIGGIITYANGTEKYFWLTKVKFSEADEEAKTEGEKKEAQTKKITGTGSARARDKVWKHSVRTDNTAFTENNQKSYFNAPYEITAVSD